MRRIAIAACAALTVALPLAAAQAAGTVTSIGTTSTKAGVVVTGASSRTLYFFGNDKTTKSTCYKTCAVVWPPVLAKKKPKALGKAKASLLGLTKRTDGTEQVTYNGKPLYYYIKDKKKGSLVGNYLTDSFGFWGALAPNGKIAKKS